MRDRNPHRQRKSACGSFPIERLEDRLPLAGDIAGAFGDAATLVRDVNEQPATRGIQLPFVGTGEAAAVEMGGHVYFFVYDGVRETELWRTNGSEDGTRLIKEINTHPADCCLNVSYREDGVRNLAIVGEELFFVLETVLFDSKADLPYGDAELWKSDGTEEGTVFLKTIGDWGWGTESTYTQLEESVGSLMMSVTQWSSSDGIGELWVSDGTAAGTVPYARFVMPFVDPIGDLVRLDDDWYFLGATWPDFGLWKTNPATQQTTLVTLLAGDPNVGIGPNGLTLHNGSLYFAASEVQEPFPEAVEFELWKSDGTTEGTVQVKDIYPGESGSDPSRFASFNGELFFIADDGTHGRQLWKSDGTAVGTVMVAEIAPENSRHYSWIPQDAGETLFFTVSSHQLDGTWIATDWVTDGTTAGTVKVEQIAAEVGSFEGAFPTSDGLYFTVRSLGEQQPIELWKYNDGDLQLVKQFTGVIDGLSDFGYLGGTLFFSVWTVQPDGTRISAAWTTDGTENGTKSIGAGLGTYLADVNGKPIFIEAGGLQTVNIADAAMSPIFQFPSQTLGSRPFALTATNDGVYFLSEHDERLRRSDGTSSGTVALEGSGFVHPFSPDPSGVVPTSQMEFVGDSKLFLLGGDGLWVHDVESDQMVLIKGGLTDVEHLVAMTSSEDTLFFTRVAYPGSFRQLQLWESDGTVDGTVMLYESDELPYVGLTDRDRALLRNRRLAFAGDTIFFLAPRDAGNWKPHSLWKSDGTEAGTGSMDVHFVECMIGVDDALYFVRRSSEESLELWISDGTEEGTKRVKEIRTKEANTIPSDFGNVNGTLYFSAGDGTLWKSDGSQEGTTLVKEFPTNAALSDLTSADGYLFFAADDGIQGRELWMSNGTTEGTVLAADIRAGNIGSDPSELTVRNNQLFFAADDGRYGRELWSIKTDQPLPGDADRDGGVYFADFLRLVVNFNKSGAVWEDGDFNADGFVSFEDFLILSRCFGLERPVAEESLVRSPAATDMFFWQSVDDDAKLTDQLLLDREDWSTL